MMEDGKGENEITENHMCAGDEDGGENCKEQIFPVSMLEQLEEEGLLPGFNLLLAISALGVVGMLRRRTH